MFHEVERVPLHCCQLIESREAALRAPTGRLRLSFCDACGFIQNDAFDPAEIDYSESYEDSQAFSPRFLSFARGLVDRLVESYGLRGRDIIEIGCGKGDFLKLLCEAGGNRGVGVDPAYVVGRLESEALDRIEFVRDFFPLRDRKLRGELLCCRHTLEHLPEVKQFVGMLRGTLEGAEGTAVFFEVPDVTRVLEELAFWDLYYEHCSYFSPGSLARLFRASGFEVLELARGFEEQYVLLDARPADSATLAAAQRREPLALEDDLERLRSAVERFVDQIPPALASWQQELQAHRSAGRSVVLWGAGSKAVGFLTTLSKGSGIDYVVDINPHKHGMHLAGTGQRIVSPAFLKECSPDLVIVMNPVYRDEIRGDLASMGLEPEVVAL